MKINEGSMWPLKNKLFPHEIAMTKKSQTEMNISSWLFHTTS